MFATTRRSTVLTAVVTVLGIFFFSEAFSADYVSVKADNVNVRTGAGTNYEVSMELFARISPESYVNPGRMVENRRF